MADQKQNRLTQFLQESKGQRATDNNYLRTKRDELLKEAERLQALITTTKKKIKDAHARLNDLGQ